MQCIKMSNTSLELRSRDNCGEHDHTVGGSFELRWMSKFVRFEEEKKKGKLISFDVASVLAKQFLASTHDLQYYGRAEAAKLASDDEAPAAKLITGTVH